MISRRREDHLYTHCYCEENIYKLLQKVVDQRISGDECEWYAVVISACHLGPGAKVLPGKWTAGGFVPIDCTRNGGSCTWDYHVIAVERKTTPGTSFVFDFDTGLTFPCPFPEYILRSFGRSPQACFRVVPAQEYLDTMASDRSHMMKPGGTGGYSMVPPPYAPIRGPKATEANNLASFINMDNVDFAGRVMTRDEFFKFGA